MYKELERTLLSTQGMGVLFRLVCLAFLVGVSGKPQKQPKRQQVEEQQQEQQQQQQEQQLQQQELLRQEQQRQQQELLLSLRSQRWPEQQR